MFQWVASVRPGMDMEKLLTQEMFQSFFCDKRCYIYVHESYLIVMDTNGRAVKLRPLLKSWISKQLVR